jgi:all-trans-retinol 13,14-reductase
MKKQKHWSKAAPEGPWDTIIIGSGMGGMTTAAMLSKLGHRVLVLEQHYVPGGFTHTFRRKGYLWDVGVHAIGEVTEKSMPGRLLKRLTDDRLKWASLGSVYEKFRFPGGVEIDFPDSPEQFRANLLAAFPDEEAAIDAYLAEVKRIGREMKGYYLSRTLPGWMIPAARLLMARPAEKSLARRTAEVINELTDNERLKTVFAAQWGYYGSPPSRSSFAMQALVVRHFLHGGYYPVGGSQRIAEELLRTVAEAGGWTRINADVAEILVEGGQAVGVRMADGEEIRASRVVSAAGIRATVERLLPESARQEGWSEKIRSLAPASAHVCLYIGFKGDIRSAGVGSHNLWLFNTWDAEQEVWDVSDPDHIADAPILYCSFPSLKDPEHDPGPEQRHTGEVVTFVDWDLFADWQGSRWRKRGEDYEAFKQKITDALIRQLTAAVPGLADKIDYVELSTPLSTDHFCRPVRGSIYGLEPTPERFATPWLRPRAPIPGLFFSGSEVSTVGVIGARMGGVLCAAAIEPRKGMRYLKES